MELSEARRMAETLIGEHGLVGWALVFDRARVRAGVCRPGACQIGLSRVLTGLHSEAEVRDTVLHEIAHALVGIEHGHDAVWRAAARRIGCSASRCLPPDAPRAPAPWTGSCPAGHQVTRQRRPARVASCRQCAPAFDPAALLTWAYRGRQVAMGPRYDTELALVAGADGLAGGARTDSAARVGHAQQLLAKAYAVLPVGSRVRLGGSGRHAGVVGTVEKRGRTRYHVRTRVGVLTAPFALVHPA